MLAPDKVIKRTGGVVRFDKARITDAIMKAASSLGGTDGIRAEELSDTVSGILVEKFGNTPPKIEDIQNTVEKVLIEAGHAATAKAYILYRNERDSLRKKTKVRRTVKKKTNTTDAHLLVESDTHSEYAEWDKSAIRDTLVKETDISAKEAREIAAIVEKRVLQSGVSKIGTSLIRELINNELFERGKRLALSNQSSYGISKTDLENLIFSKSQENSNITANNPEAINFSLAETVLKKYALDHVFSRDVAEAHKTGAVHIHDLGHPTRYYSYADNSVVSIFLFDNNIPTTRKVCMSDLWRDTKADVISVDGMEIKLVEGLLVGDIHGVTKIAKVMRHKNTQKMLEVVVGSASVTVTADHPFIVFPNSNCLESEATTVPTQNLLVGQYAAISIHKDVDQKNNDGMSSTALKFQHVPCGYSASQVVSVKEVEYRNEYVYDITTESSTFICNDIYVHNCSGHSIEYIKKYGLKLGNLDTSSAPAKYARVLTGHINTFLASIQAYYAGALGLGAVNVLYAPYLEGLSDTEIYQEAQNLIFSCAQNAFSKGGQVAFSDHNVHFGVPPHLKNVKAIGPGGIYTGKTYADYEDLSNKFLRCMLQVWDEGDMYGHMMAFPKADIHINEDTFSNPEHNKLFKYACEIASRNGLPYFVFDRDGVSISMCCRLKSKVPQDVLDRPEMQNFCGFQNVTINLPQCAYKAGKGNFKELLSEIDKAIDICIQAHLQKKNYVAQLMTAPNLPLWEMGKPSCNGVPYVDLNKATYIVGLIGLNECMQYMVGKELHEGDSVVRKGLNVVSHMYYALKEYGNKYGLNFTLEESPAESASRRFSRVDLKNFPESADYIRGNIKNDDTHYTNSIHLRADAPVDLITRIKTQAKFHNLIESGAIIHAFVGENRPSAKSIEKLVELTWRKTNAAQITISPEFTICKKCHKMIPGMQVRCGSCGAENISSVKRVANNKNGTWNLDRIKQLKE